MNYSTTYAAIIVNILAVVLPKAGVTIGTDELTTTVQTIIAIITGLWVLKERHGKGDVTAIGFKR